MKRAFIIIMLILCCTLSTTADTNQLSLSEALAIAEGQFVGKDVDYYVLQEDNASVWTIFVDAEPTKGWEHDCCIIVMPKSFNFSSSTTIPTRRTQLRMPPSGNFVPLRVKNSTTSSITVDISNLHNGAYAVVYSAQGELIDQKKFNK